MQQFVQMFEGFSGDVAMGIEDEKLQQKYHLTADELSIAKELYLEDNSTALEKLLQSKLPEIPDAVDEAPPEVVITPEERPEFGYKAKPRSKHLFVKPLEADHKGRVMLPPAYQPNSDMGYVDAVASDVEGIEEGTLVLFDKYAEAGNRFKLVDKEGDLVDLIQLMDVNVTAILEKVKLDAI